MSSTKPPPMGGPPRGVPGQRPSQTVPPQPPQHHDYDPEATSVDGPMGMMASLPQVPAYAPPQRAQTPTPTHVMSGGIAPATPWVSRSRLYSFVLDEHGLPVELGSGRFAKAYLGEER